MDGNLDTRFELKEQEFYPLVLLQSKYRSGLGEIAAEPSGSVMGLIQLNICEGRCQLDNPGMAELECVTRTLNAATSR